MVVGVGAWSCNACGPALEGLDQHSLSDVHRVGQVEGVPVCAHSSRRFLWSIHWVFGLISCLLSPAGNTESSPVLTKVRGRYQNSFLVMFLATWHSGRLLLFLNHLVPLLTNGSAKILTEQQKQATSAGKSFGISLVALKVLAQLKTIHENVVRVSLDPRKFNVWRLGGRKNMTRNTPQK